MGFSLFQGGIKNSTSRGNAVFRNGLKGSTYQYYYAKCQIKRVFAVFRRDKTTLIS